MKLLSQKSNKDARDKEEVLKKLRLQDVEEELRRKTELLTSMQEEFAGLLLKQREEYEHEKDLQMTWRNKIAAEIMELENDKAMLPIERKRQELDNRERELNRVQEVLQQRLDEVGEKEYSVIVREQRVLAREKGVQLQAQTISNQSSQLTKTLEQLL